MLSSDLLTVEVRPDGRRLVLVLRGELDHFTAEAASLSVELALAEDWNEVVIDLSALSFMDAGGLSLLFSLREPRRTTRWLTETRGASACHRGRESELRR